MPLRLFAIFILLHVWFRSMWILSLKSHWWKKWFWLSRKQVRQKVSWIVLSTHFHVLIGSKSTWGTSWEESHKTPKVVKWYWFSKVTKVKSENLFVFVAAIWVTVHNQLYTRAYSPCQQCLKLLTFFCLIDGRAFSSHFLPKKYQCTKIFVGNLINIAYFACPSQPFYCNRDTVWEVYDL